MILFVPEYFWVLIIKLKADHANKLVTGAWWKYFKRLLLSYKSWMLFVMSIAMLIRMPEAYAINVTVKAAMMSTTSFNAADVLPTANLVSLLKVKKPISIPENEVITSADTEDYLEEDSDEDDYDDVRRNNGSGKWCFIVFLDYRLQHETLYMTLLLFYADHGLLVGSRCEFTCDKRLHHVFCNPISSKCECEKNYPVKIGRSSMSLNTSQTNLH